jgi:hypothetical protein
MLITHTDLDMYANFTWMHRGLHCDPNSVKVFEFLLDQVVVLEPTEHRGVLKLKPLLFSNELCF